MCELDSIGKRTRFHLLSPVPVALPLDGCLQSSLPILMKRFAIVTASDRNYGDFLIEHWLRSLRENVCLDAIEVVLLNYGLSLAQRFYLEHHGVLLRRGKRDGHVTVVRYRETRDLLFERPYEQICLIDSGDIIFQDDIASLFERSPDTYRAVCEDFKPVLSFFIKNDFFRPEDRQ